MILSGNPETSGVVRFMAGGGTEQHLHEGLEALLEEVLEVSKHLLDALLCSPRPLHISSPLSNRKAMLQVL